jgi:hypothetical protein
LAGGLGVGRFPLDRNNHQGWYGECFVQVLAAAAGFGVAKPYPDVAGIDFHIVAADEVGDDYSIAKVQVKSWSAANGDDIAWHFRLTEKHFNALAGTPAVPAFLFLIVVPTDKREYASADPRQMSLSHAGYWASLAGRPRIANPSSTRHVPIVVPRRNLLTVASLTTLLRPDSVAGLPAGPTTTAGTP